MTESEAEEQRVNMRNQHRANHQAPLALFLGGGRDRHRRRS